MKSLNHDTRQLPRHDTHDTKKMADDKDADAFMLLPVLLSRVMP